MGFIALGVALLAVCVFILFSIRSLRVSAPIWVEGPVIGAMEAIRAGRLYQMAALKTPPYSVLTHPPIAYYLGYLCYAARPAYWPLRLLNMAATAGCALLILKLVRAETQDRLIAPQFAASCFLVCTPVLVWSQVARSVDSLACLFSLCALLAATRLEEGWRRNMAIALFFALAVLSKQTALAVLGPTLAFYEVFTRRRPGRVLWWAAGGLCILVPVVAWFQWRSGGGFLVNVVSGNLVRMTGYQWLLVNRLLILFWLFVAAVLIVGRWGRSIAYSWFAFSCLFGLATVSKKGSGTMYFFDSAAAIGILAGFALARALGKRRPLSVAVLCAALLLETSGVVTWRYLNGARCEGEYHRMLAFLRAHEPPKGQILSEDAGVAVQLGLTPLWDDPFVLNELSLKGRWDDSRLAAGLHRREYFAVVLRDMDLWPASMRAELMQQYWPAAVYEVAPSSYSVYLPFREPPGPRP